MKIQSTTTNRQLRGLARGFSLFEMVIVMGIIGVILGGVIPDPSEKKHESNGSAVTLIP